MPGDPAQTLAGEYASAQDIKAIRDELALNQNFFVRYFKYVKNITSLNFGNSIYSNQSVLKLILKHFPATFIIAFFSILIAVIIGITSGIFAAVYKNRYPDKIILMISSVFISTPIFVSCIFLAFIFSYLLGVLPPSGKSGCNPAFIILPALALASRSLALIIRIVRNELISVLNRQYIMVAYASGFPLSKIIFVFALKNIIVPIIAIILLDFGAYLGGAVVTETFFAWPGIGRLLVIALHKRDIPVIQGIIIFGIFIFIVIGIIINVLQRTILPEDS